MKTNHKESIPTKNQHRGDNMTTYIYTETKSDKIHMDIAITVFKQRRGKSPELVGKRHYQTRSWSRAKVEANRVIDKREGYTLIDAGYGGIGNKSVKVYRIKI